MIQFACTGLGSQGKKALREESTEIGTRRHWGRFLSKIEM